VCGVGHVRLCVCVIRGIPVAVDLLERVSVRCWAGPSVYVCVSYEECRVAIGLLERVNVCVGQVRLFVRVSYEECRVAVGLLERLSVWCWACPSMCVCHTRNTGSSRSAGESECVVLGRSVRLCVCVIRGMPSSCRSAGESEYVVFGRSVCLCVCHTRNAV